MLSKLRLRSPLLLAVIALIGCSATSVERAGQGALSGAAAGAVGSMFAAAIFGGDIGDAAARGAAFGAGVGAVSGAVQGSAEHERKLRAEEAERERRQQSELARLRSEIGDDAFAGLEALTMGKHEVAIAYAKTAARSSNSDHALAGHWLEVLTFQDSGDSTRTAEHLPHLVAMDDHVSTLEEARRMLADLENGLQEIRTEFGY